VTDKNKLLYAFYIPTFIALLIGGFFIFSQPKSQIHLIINGWHTPFADYFFKYVTYLGEGWMFLLAVPLFLFHSGRAALHMVFAALITLVLTGVLKQVIFVGTPRPIEYFSTIANLYLVPGVEMHRWNSFPSGHTTAAFAVWLTLAKYLKYKWQVFGCFSIAFLVGYSRMYLSQHFLIDVEFGAMLGMIAFFFGNYLTNLLKISKLDKPFIKFTK
jgi:membrane-associated phospholipid phosphatase